MGEYKSQHTGQQIDAGVYAALNPDTVPTANSNKLIMSKGVKEYVDNRVIANPMFDGGESRITCLQVGNTKYNVEDVCIAYYDPPPYFSAKNLYDQFIDAYNRGEICFVRYLSEYHYAPMSIIYLRLVRDYTDIGPTPSSDYQITEYQFSAFIGTVMFTLTLEAKTIISTGETTVRYLTPDANYPVQIIEVATKEYVDGKALPAVSASDNGKVLMVVDGEWSVVDFPANNVARVER